MFNDPELKKILGELKSARTQSEPQGKSGWDSVADKTTQILADINKQASLGNYSELTLGEYFQKYQKLSNNFELQKKEREILNQNSDVLENLVENLEKQGKVKKQKVSQAKFNKPISNLKKDEELVKTINKKEKKQQIFRIENFANTKANITDEALVAPLRLTQYYS